MPRRMLTLGALLISATLAQGCTGQKPGDNGTGNPDDRTVEPVRAGIEIATSEGALQSGEIVSAVNFVYLRDLWVRVKVPPVMMNRLTEVQLTFINPRGEISYEDTTPYSNDVSLKTTTGKLGHDDNVFQAKGIPGGYAFDRPIPVAGSVLQRIPAPEGKWVVEAKLGSSAEKLSYAFDVTNSR